MDKNHRFYSVLNKRTTAIALLFASTLTWFLVINNYLLKISTSMGLDRDLSYVGILVLAVAIIASGFGGSLISEKVDRRKFLIVWISFGLLTSVSIVFAGGLAFFIVLNAMIGVSFGLGFPTCQAFLTESVSVEKRGRTTGATFALIIILTIVIVSMVDSLGQWLLALILSLTILKGIGFIAVMIDPCKRETGTITQWRSILKSKEFVSYGAAWVVFQLANGITLTGKFASIYKSVSELAIVLQLLASICAAITAGYLADRYGRKQPMIIGLFALGVSYAFLGFMSQEPFVYLVYMTVEGFALGMLLVIYVQIILGDLSAKSGSKERYYALGGYLIAFSIPAIFEVVTQWYSLTVPINVLTAVLSVITLLSIIPILRAPETLPQQVIQERKLREHIKKVEEIIQESKER